MTKGAKKLLCLSFILVGAVILAIYMPEVLERDALVFLGPRPVSYEHEKKSATVTETDLNRYKNVRIEVLYRNQEAISSKGIPFEEWRRFEKDLLQNSPRNYGFIYQNRFYRVHLREGKSDLYEIVKWRDLIFFLPGAGLIISGLVILGGALKRSPRRWTNGDPRDDGW